MRRPLRLALIAGVAALAVGGAGVSAALMDMPQDAVPAQDPPQDPPSEPAPAGDPAPEQPVPVTPPGGADAIASAVAAVQEAGAADEEAEAEAEEEEAEEEEVVAAPPEPEGPPGLRQRRRYAIVQAVDKVTAETMRFEVEVNGRPVAFNKTLIFRARACEVSASDEIARDAVAYLEISAQPRTGGQETRQLFRGWMFASSPGLSGLQHPVYDAWVVGCRA
ncbi:DUF2155 domain-containing protein [Brevundimonas sp.]|uniref:DUF2155 domain-containing protein n=1 Tax=Brevundimonas sp. TaxID=1871086 RepID=UPI002E104108|nr:DUF2155 domain-containing protein [Brevundimonas sp.]